MTTFPKHRTAAASRRWWQPLAAALMGAALLAPAAKAQTTAGDQTVLDAREALRKKDRARLAQAKAASAAANHPLAMWADYWELTHRLNEAQQPELDAFWARWPGTYVEDRLRNDWLLELGRRKDWANFATEYPRFRMNDDRDVACYALLLAHRAGEDVRDRARDAWLAQRDADEGCDTMATALVEAGVFKPADVWRKLRFAAEANRPRAVRQTAALAGSANAAAIAELLDNPARYLARKANARGRDGAELALLALVRIAGNDPDAAAAQLDSKWDKALPGEQAAWAWSAVAKQAALKLQADAPEFFQRAALRTAKDTAEAELPDDLLAWKVRAALRADDGKPRWQQVVQAVNAMSASEQKDPAWAYWKARALLALAPNSQDSDGMRTLARELLDGIATPMHFYGKLAAEELGREVALPPPPAPLTAEERRAAAEHPGLARALRLIAIGLRNEGVREWNWSLRGMGDRELLAAAQLACDREVWDRCINSSDRTKAEIDLNQRYPMPFRAQVLAKAKEVGVDPAYVYGLIRQESRFIMDARSHVGASGLMQIMPATAKWTAKKIGLDFTQDLITDRDTNLMLGTSYLKLVLDDFGGSQAMAAAAYNAGPGRPRRWREGPLLEAAAWAENIPFNETRDYVKKVLSNATIYGAMIAGTQPSLKARLGRTIGPRDAAAPPDKDLP